MFMTISLVIFFVLFLILFVPSSICVKINITCDRYFLDIRKTKGMDNNVRVKLCGVLPVFNKELFEKKKKQTKPKKESKLKKVFKDKNTLLKIIAHGYVDKFVLSLGFNLDDYIANSYVNATLNTIICMYINLNQNKFNLKRLYYQTYIGENLANLNFEGIIKISVADTIKVIGKEYFRLLKEEKKENKILVFKKRREEYGRASD